MSRLIALILLLPASAAYAGVDQWTPVGPAAVTVQALGIDPSNPRTLYAGTTTGIFKTTDSGRSWQQVYASNPLDPTQIWSVNGLALDAAAVQTTLAIGMAGIFRPFPSSPLRSPDRGITWAQSGPTNLVWTFVLADLSTTQTFYVGSGGGDLFRTRDGGVGWERLSLPPGSSPASLAIDPADHNRLLLGLIGRGVLRSTDGGSSWTPGNQGLPTPSGDTPSIFAIGIDPAAPLIVYAAGISYPPFPANSIPDFFQSTDGGASWHSIALRTGTPNIQAIAMALTNSTTVSVATSDMGVLQSQDLGETWTQVNSGLPSLNVSKVWAGAAGSGALYASSGGGLFRIGSADETCATGPTAVAAVDPAPICPGGAATLVGSGGASCTWSPSYGLADSTKCVTTASPATTQYYFLRVTDAAGCVSSNTASVTVTVLAGPSSPLLSAAASAFSGQSGLVASVPLHAASSYRWTVTNGAITAGQGTNAITFSAGAAGFLFLSVTETNSFGCSSAAAMTVTVLGPPPLPLCVTDAQTLCLADERFKVQANWRTSAAPVSAATALPLTANTGGFWFFDPTNLELVVKVLDGRSVNGKFWVFYGSLTNVEFTLTVSDTQTGAAKTYLNPQGQLASVADTSAF